MRQKSLLRVIAEPLLIAVALAIGVRAAVSIYSIPSASMMPSLQAGDHILVMPYRWDEPQRGDVVVFRSPLDSSQLMVKRIIAVPGDLIDTRAGHVRIGERTISEPYLLRQAATGAISPQIIPQSAFFMMGDNREDSLDSRKWGAIKSDQVIGRVQMVLWSSPSIDDQRTANAASVSRDKRAVTTLRVSRIFKCVE